MKKAYQLNFKILAMSKIDLYWYLSGVLLELYQKRNQIVTIK